MTIYVADGTYGPIVLKRCVGSGTVTITGNTPNPANCVINAGAAIAIYAPQVTSRYDIMGVRMSGTSYGLLVSGPGLICVASCDFATTGGAQIYADNGAFVSTLGNYTISAGAQRHVWALGGGYVQISGRTITLTGTPSFSSAFVVAQFGYILAPSNTFSGAAAGPRYLATENGVISTGGGGANYLPGNAAGAASEGGIYV